MGIGGYILAGALQGAGNAITSQANSDADARRQVAIENLKAANKRDSTMFEARIADAADATKQARTNGYALKLTDARGEVQKDVDANRGTITAQNDAANDSREFSNAKALENLRTRNDMSKADHDAAIDAVRADKEIVRTEVLASGQLMGVTKTGQTKALMGRGAGGKPIYLRTARPKEDSGDDSVGATVGATRRPAATTSAAPAPAVAARGTPAGGAGIGRGTASTAQPLSPERIFQLSEELGPPDFMAPPAAGGGAQSYTVKQLKEFATQTGMSESEARAWARERGFTITAR